MRRLRLALASAGRRLLPAPMRRQLRWGYVRLVESQLTRRRSARNRTVAAGVAVTGQLHTPSGLGAGARAFAEWFARRGSAVYGVNVSMYASHSSFNGLPIAPHGFGGLVVCVANPPHLVQDLLQIRRSGLRPSYVIAHWVWELVHCPREWSRFDRLVDEIWVPSEFVRNAVVPLVRCPVRVVPYPLRAREPSPRSLASFGLPTADFVALTALDLRSGFYRKNVLGSVRAFRHAFADDRRALLVVKVDGRKFEPHCARALSAAIADAPNIVVIDDILSADDMNALVANADTILSLHRSEGFGLLLAEAMLLSKPVVATGWSGNVDFMDETSAVLVPYSLVRINDRQRIYSAFGGHWAEPDIESAARSLRRLADDRRFALDLGQRASARIRDFFDDARIAAAMDFHPECLHGARLDASKGLDSTIAEHSASMGR